MSARKYLSAGFELALSNGDVDSARRILEDIRTFSVGQSVRGKSYHRSAAIRLAQLDPQFDCNDETLAELRELYSAAKRLGSADGVTLALCEVLLRRGKRYEVRQLLDDYIHSSRRERGVIPPSLEKLVAMCGIE
jgi:hypothetical protein